MLIHFFNEKGCAEDGPTVAAERSFDMEVSWLGFNVINKHFASLTQERELSPTPPRQPYGKRDGAIGNALFG